MPFWHINGEMTTETIWEQMRDAKSAGFTGVSVLPLAEKKNGRPGTTPKFLTEKYMQRYQDVLDAAEALEMEVILYDDNDFPTGMAGGKLGELFPKHTMKRLDKIEFEINGPTVFSETIPEVKIMAVVAMNQKNERIDLSGKIRDKTLTWQVPEGNWKIMLFILVKDSWHKAYPVVDYLDTTAVRHMINLTYDVYKERFSPYFGNTIKMTFFDDVGFWRHPKTWTGKFNERFKDLNGYDPKPYYPALWYNIGSETEAIRNDFFNTRAELLAEGFPKLVAQWNEKHGLKSTGHPPGNYQPSPIDMNADIFKFYRYTQVPLMDAIKGYEYGTDGHKLISSAADYYDRPVVAVEVYGAFKEEFDSAMLYRPVMDLFQRGVNFVIPHGMWYNPDLVYIPPLVSPYNKDIVDALPSYSDYVGRCCMLLQGGRRVADEGVMDPFEELAGWYRFDDPDISRQGRFISPETDYLEISHLLTNEIRRDFTFIHPEFFTEEKYEIDNGTIYLNNSENQQHYKTLMLTGSKVISYKTLQKAKAFYDDGGHIISTTFLPVKSAEMGKDEMVVKLIQYIFGVNPLKQEKIEYINTNSNNGRAVFIPNPTKEKLRSHLNEVEPADVMFSPNPKLSTDFGKFSYIHKKKIETDIFYFANSSDESIETDVLLKGKLQLEEWNPHDGSIEKIDVVYQTLDNIAYTKTKLKLDPVKSTFLVGK
ncbi:MAG: hypothetical protein K9G70_08620 [Prolixibacteraceae bacterium]|nr:hypothetical protein [Prolixibacteraceae bacterium]